MSDSYLFPTTVKVSFVLGDSFSATNSTLKVKQFFDSRFLQDGLTNMVRYSGNPGYLPGKELLLALKQGDVLLRPINGVKLRSGTDTTTGQCSSVLNTVDMTGEQAILFGVNSSVQCHVATSASNFSTLCTSA